MLLYKLLFEESGKLRIPFVKLNHYITPVSSMS